MSRFTPANIIKMVLAFVFSIFVAFYVLLIGVAAKNKKVILEGAVYGVLFAIFFSNPNALGGSVGFLGLGVMAVAAVRTYMLRDLWLPVRVPEVRSFPPVQPFVAPQVMAPRPQAYVQPAQPQQAYAQPVPQQPPHIPAARPTDRLTAALAWVSSTAKENKYRFPADTYVTILETCQTLDAVIEAEAKQRSGDAAFEYELGALVQEYLPAVLKGYLAVPAGMVNDKQPNGRTPNEELSEQLELLSGQADALHASRYGQTSAELSSMGNFLRDRFGHRKQDGFDFGIE